MGILVSTEDYTHLDLFSGSEIRLSNVDVMNLGRAQKAAGLPFGVNNEARESRLMSLAKSPKGSERKFLRFIDVYFRLTAPLSFYVEFDTYKCGVDRMSTSIMHTIMKTGLTKDNFSCFETGNAYIDAKRKCLYLSIIDYVKEVIDTKNLGKITDSVAITLIKDSIPGGFYYTSEIKTNYEVLRRMILDRTGHRLVYWGQFLEYIKEFPNYDEYLI